MASPQKDPFQWLSDQINKPKAKPASGGTRNVGMSPAGKRRLGSVGVSSTARHRTKKRPR